MSKSEYEAPQDPLAAAARAQALLNEADTDAAQARPRSAGVPPSHETHSDPLLDCLVQLTHLHGKPYTAQALSNGLPLVDQRLTPSLLARAAARAHFRFLRLVPDEGVPHYPESKFIEVKRVRAPADVARLMDLKSGDAVIFIKRVQYFDGIPTIVEELWLPGLIFKGLTAERLVEYKGPMYGLFETEFGTRMIRASEQIRAVCADAGAAQLLNIDLGTPLLSSERVSFTYGDKPVELRRGLYLTSRHHYQNELS